MRILEKSCVSEDMVRAHQIVDNISFKDNKVGELTDKLDRSDNEPLLEILNAINNQGIQKIDVETYSYYNRGVKLKFDSFSTAEKVFFVAYAADRLGEDIYLWHDVTQLTKSVFKTFVRLFHNSGHITILYEHEKEKIFFDYMIQEALK
jgi:hypothetical protein